MENNTSSTSNENSSINRTTRTRRATRPANRVYNLRPSTLRYRDFLERQRGPPHRLRIRRRLRTSADDIIDLSTPPSITRNRPGAQTVNSGSNSEGRNMYIPTAFFSLLVQFPIIIPTNPRLAERSGLSDHEIGKNTLLYDYQPEHASRSIEADKKESIENFDQKDKCCICLDHFSQANTLRRLPCMHLFHKQCIDGWLKNNTKCPLCRVSVIVDYDDLIRSLESGHNVEQILMRQG